MQPRDVVLVRHGETEGQSSIRLHGAGDVALSDLGRGQMREARRKLGPRHFDRVVASPLCRAREGARLIAPDAEVEIEEDFREIHFGRWEGLTLEEVRALDPELYAVWRSHPPDFAYPGGESLRAFRFRVDAGLERVLAGGGDSLLVVAHKGVVRRLCERLCGCTPVEEQLGLGSILMLEGLRTAAASGGATHRLVEALQSTP